MCCLRIRERTMKGKHAIIICFSVLLLLVAAFVGVKEQQWNKQHSISVEIVSDGGVEEVKLWMSPQEEYYLFLPSYADLSQVQIRRHVGGRVYLDGRLITGTVSCSEFPLNEPMELIHDSYFGYQWNRLTILQSANVPAMYIDVKSGKMDYIHAEKGNREAGLARLYTADGRLDSMAVLEEVQGRGNSTWLWRDKKPYSLRLSEETDLLGMGQGGRWVLLADAFDRSLIKNKTALDLARNAGMPYTPDCQWVDLYLNGEYAGLYLLCERNEVHANRVDIPAKTSFLVSWESESRLVSQGYPHVVTRRGTAMRVHHSGFGLEKVQQVWQSVENAIFAEDGIDPVTGKHWQELIDQESWAKLFLVDEISGDYDGGKISKFFYYIEENGVGKLYAGPVWDKDDSFATGHWSITSPNCMIASRSAVIEGEEKNMFRGLRQKEAFRACVAEVYQNTFQPLLEELYHAGIEEYARWIAQAAQLTEIRWKYGYTEDQHQIICNYLGERMDFLEEYWVRKEEFCHVEIFDTKEGSVGEFAVRPGDQIPAIPQYDSDAVWYVAGSGELFDVTQPIWEDVKLVLRSAETE